MSDWYEAGLPFRCTACGDCCTGDPGVVWVNEDEIAALAAHLGLDVEAFEREFVRRKGIRRSLHERFNGDCVLFDSETRSCSVYQARPTQCRTWPFWKQNLASPRAWAETCEICPGSGTGDVISVERIRRHLQADAEARTKS